MQRGIVGTSMNEIINAMALTRGCIYGDLEKEVLMKLNHST